MTQYATPTIAWVDARAAATAALCGLLALFSLAAPAQSQRRPVTEEHPRLLGSRDELRQLATDRVDAWQRVVRVARGDDVDDHTRMLCLGLVNTIEDDADAGRQAVALAMRLVDSPIRIGHVPYGADLAAAALVFDLCHEHFTTDQRRRLIDYVNKTAEGNAESHQHVFHNGWWGYKHGGIGLACYATYHENPRARQMLDQLERDYRERAAPALRLAGAGGGWAEGYYIHYWLYDWLVFCEVARRQEGIDYHAAAPEFYRQRAVASMFEMYPGISEYGSRRPAPMGDGGGRRFGGDRDKALSARRILVNRYRDDPAHQAVHAYNELTPRSAVGNYAYMDFLWRDDSITAGPLDRFQRSHLSPGPGYVWARSDWSDEATWFFFKCGDRFTAHQHLDVNHFLIYRHAELAGDGGHYDGFGTRHDINYHLRTIAHNTIAVHDPSERWPNIRGGNVTGNDGGQHHNWPHHNGGVSDPQEWRSNRQLYDIADLLAFEDRGRYLYVAGDATRAYAPAKLEMFTRQVVYVRPGSFIVFDRVTATEPSFKKTWLLQALAVPEKQGDHLVVTHGDGRLFVQTLLPSAPTITLAHGKDLYAYGGDRYEPMHSTGQAPECRIEVSPGSPARTDYFLHVLTATDADVEMVRPATMTQQGKLVIVTLSGGDVGERVRIAFDRHRVAGWIDHDGQRRRLATGLPQD